MRTVLRTTACAVVAALAIGTLHAEEAGPGAARYAEAQALLRTGRVEEAAEAFRDAARLEPARADYVERATLLRRVAGLRRVVAEQPDAATWEKSAAALHAFYLDEGLAALAVDVDRRAHARRPAADTAARLAEALLAAGENVEAANLAATHSAASPRHATWHAIALARLGRAEDARRLAAGLPPLGEEPEGADCYDRARLQALLGEPSEALRLLRRAFERTPGPALPAWRGRAARERDFAALVALPAWVETLRTESKVKATCSGGATCASCPNRGACGSGGTR